MSTRVRDRIQEFETNLQTVGPSAYLYVLPAVIVYLVLMLYPLAKVFLISFQDYSSLTGDNPWVGLANYERVLSDPVFWQAAQNTLVYGIVAITIPVVFGLVLAALLNVEIRGSTTIRSIIFTPVIVPIVVASILFGWIFNPMGILNSILLQLGVIDSQISWLSVATLALPAVLVMVVWKRTGYYMVILLAGLQSIPDDVYEAARIQGKSRWQIFRHVTVPMAKPAIVIVLILGLINSVKAFAEVYIMTQGGPGHATEILGTYFYKQTFAFFNLGTGAAVGFIQFGITLVLALVFFYVKGD